MEGLIELIRRYPVSDWIVWVGAGVSMSRPTSLPSGPHLTRFAIDATCGAAVRERLEWTWAAACEHSRLRIAPIPRLETILGAFADAEKEAPSDTVRFLRGFASFAAAPPNENHGYLAELVRRGATVITTNFDLCVQRAIDSSAGAEVCRVVESTGGFRRYHAGPGAGEVIHLHGVADDLENLGATLEQVKKRLPESATAYLAARLNKGAVLLFVGYSLSDAFDVNPFFTARPPGSWPRSTLAFLQHSEPDWDSVEAIPLRVRAVAAGFGEVRADSGPTTRFLMELSGTDLPSLPGAFDWRAEFGRNTDGFRSGEAGAVLTCALANGLGINVDVLDPTAFKRAEAHNPGFGPQPYHAVLALAGRGRGAPRKEAEYLGKGGGAPLSDLGYQYARGRLLRARRHAMSVGEIVAEAERPADEVVGWPPYTSMSVHGRLMLAPYFIFPWRRPTTARARGRLTALLRAAQLLAARPLDAVLVIHQIPTALRFTLLLTALMEGRIDATLESRILDLYAEQANVAGFVSGYRDFAIARVLALRHLSGEERDRSMREVLELLDRSAALAETVGDHGAVRRAARLRRYLVWIRLAGRFRLRSAGGDPAPE